MTEYALYGARLRELLRLEQAPTYLVRTSRQAEIAVTRCTDPDPAGEVSQAFPSKNAFLAILHLADCQRWELWLGNRHLPTQSLVAGALTIHDLRRSPAVGFSSPYDALFFYLPHHALDDIALEAGVSQPSALRETGGAPVFDDAIRQLAKLLAPAFCETPSLNRGFVENVILATCAHLADRYGDRSPRAALERGGLAPWQESRAKAMLIASLDSSLSISLIARECDLSTSQFTRSFRRTTGLPPHRWLIHSRIERAKILLLEDRLGLAQIGQECGFGDQSHFTRTFTALVGASPGAWRRQQVDPPVLGNLASCDESDAAAFTKSDAPISI